MDARFKEKWLDDDLRKSLEKYHKVFRSGKEIDVEVLKEYEVLIQGILNRLIES